MLAEAAVHDQPCPTLVEAALDYLHLGLSVIPLAGKKPMYSWQQFQKELPGPRLVREWFRTRPDGADSIGVVAGPVSGGLVVADFDDEAHYQEWSEQHPRLARRLPTSRTSRGYHVLMRSTHQRITHTPYGELRGAGYTCEPPSRHPSGSIYTWTVPLDGPPPYVPDPRRAGLLPSSTSTSRRRGRVQSSDTRPPPPHQCLVCHFPPNAEQITVASTLPRAAGERNHCLFRLARVLRALMPGASLTDLEPVVRGWFEAAVRVVRTKDWWTTWREFGHAWELVRRPAGATLSQIVSVARLDTPEDAAALEQLLAVCRSMQSHHGEGRSWPLSCRIAGQLIGTSYKTAARMLRSLCSDGVIELTRPGGTPRSRIAAEYRLCAAHRAIGV